MFNREFNMEDATLVLDQPFKVPDKQPNNGFLAPAALEPKRNVSKKNKAELPQLDFDGPTQVIPDALSKKEVNLFEPTQIIPQSKNEKFKVKANEAIKEV